MNLFGKYFSNQFLYQVSFHLVLWGGWILFPFIAGPDDPKFRQYALAIMPVTLSHIPFFFLNSSWLIPRVFQKKGIGMYLLSIIMMIIAGTILQTALKEVVVPSTLLRRHWEFTWQLLGLLFSTGISTGYGFVMYFMKREQVMRDLQEEQLKSELSFLRSQISPHFIFNVLNGLVYLIRNNREQAELITIRLSELMRYMLYGSGDKQVQLDQELGYVKNFIELQRLRFGEDVDVKIHIQNTNPHLLIEPMLIIPFVENAFKHGTGMISEPVIDIQLEVEGSQLEMRVKNKISRAAEEAKDPDSGIGLRNVQRRLELLYPESHQLDVHSDKRWFEAHLSISLESSDDLPAD
jgi:hypothetical protein